MLATEWLNSAKQNSDSIISLLESYHPQSVVDSLTLEPLPITAPGAEIACELIRRSIADEKSDSTPKERWIKALDNNDVDTIMSLLQDAWFGVPESTSCWNIKGFKEAVELLENPPYEE